MGQLRIRLFGHPQITGDHPTVKPLRRRAVLLLAYLVLRRDVFVERGKAASDLYPDSDATTAQAQFRRTLMDLQQWLKAFECFRALECSRTQLRIGDSIGSVDVWDWQTAHDSGDFENAVDLYNGDLLREFDDAWIVPIRERYARWHLDDLHSTMERTIASRPSNALRVAEACIQDDPYDERAVRAIMETQALQGDNFGALRSYNVLAERLRAELHAAPEPDTVALRDAIAGNQKLSRAPYPGLRNLSEALASHRCVTFVAPMDSQDRASDDVVNGLAALFERIWSLDAPPPALHLAQRIGDRNICIVVRCRREDDDDTGIAIEQILQTCAHARVVSVSEHPLNINGEFIVDVESCEAK